MIAGFPWPPGDLSAFFVSAAVALGDAGAGVDISVLGQYGLLGLIALALFLHTKTTVQRQADFADAAVKREIARADAERAEVARLNGLIQDRIVPVLELATASVTANQALLHDMQRERELATIRRLRDEGER